MCPRTQRSGKAYLPPSLGHWRIDSRSSLKPQPPPLKPGGQTAPLRLVCETYEAAKKAQVFVRTQGKTGLIFADGEALYFPGRRIVPVGEVRHFLELLAPAAEACRKRDLPQPSDSPRGGRRDAAKGPSADPAPRSTPGARPTGRKSYKEAVLGSTPSADNKARVRRQVWVPVANKVAAQTVGPTPPSSTCASLAGSDDEEHATQTVAFRKAEELTAIPLAPPSDSESSTSHRANTTTPPRRASRRSARPASEGNSRESDRQTRFEASAYGAYAIAANRAQNLRAELLAAETTLGLAATRAGIQHVDLSDGDGSDRHSKGKQARGHGGVTGADEGDASTGSIIPDLFPAVPLSKVEPKPNAHLPAPLALKPSDLPVSDWFHAEKVSRVGALTVADKTAVTGFQGATFNSLLRPSRPPKIVVPYALTDDQTSALLHILGGSPDSWALSPDAAPHDHPVMALVRSSVDHAVSGYYRGMPLLDVGGNPLRHLRAGRTAVHCCVPVVQPADAGRIMKWRGEASARNFRLEEACICGHGVSWCQNTASDCVASCQVIYSLDVIYYLGESHWVDLMRRAELGIVVYHRYTRQYNRYMADAKVRLFFDQTGAPWIKKWVPGNPVPYQHPYINLGEVGSMSVSVDMTREGRPLTRCVVAALGDMHVVLYYWGRLPISVVPSHRGPASAKDMRGMGTPAGVAIKDHADKLALIPVVVRWDKVDWHGLSASKIEDSLFSKFAGRVGTFTSLKALHDAVAEQYRVEMQRVNIPDNEALELRRPTVWAATARLIQEAVLSSGGAIRPTLSLGLARILAAAGMDRLYPQANFGECVEGSLIMSFLPPIPRAVRDCGDGFSWDLDFYLAQDSGATRVFRLAAPLQTKGTPGVTAGAGSQRALATPSSVCLTLICATGGLLIIAASVGSVNALLRSSPSPSAPALSRICASAMNGCLSGLAFLGISTLASRPST